MRVSLHEQRLSEATQVPSQHCTLPVPQLMSQLVAVAAQLPDEHRTGARAGHPVALESAVVGAGVGTRVGARVGAEHVPVAALQ